MPTSPVPTQAFFKRAVAVAEHYGFLSIEELQPIASARGQKLGVYRHKTGERRIDQEVIAHVLERYTQQGSELRKRSTFMFYTPSVVSIPGRPSARVNALTLNAVGASDPLTEVLVLRGAVSVLEELGIRNYLVRVNSIGDSDSSARFLREVTSQLKAKLRELPDDIVQAFKANPGNTLAKLYEERHEAVASLPSPLEFLTAPSRKHFKDLLELLEYAGIPFELDDKLYGNHTMYSHTLFEIQSVPEREQEAAIILARGGRYDPLTKVYARHTVPAIGVVIATPAKDTADQIGRPRRRKPNACLIHLGRDARIKSLSIIETFRREKIPIEQCLHFERFSEQLAYAEARQSKFVIIVGQREASQDVVIVRNADDRSQQTVPIHALPDFFRQTA